MAKYNLHLKGYVGAADFDRNKVDKCMAENADRDVTVLIDSTGGALGTGLSIAAAFKNHGAVDVHFVGLNASAATVASLGARTISMDRGAMYLVHKCSNFVFAWQSMNADQLQDYIDELMQTKADLDKIDNNIAAMYAARCRKDQKDLLDLMKTGGWLTAKEALDWGFIDKITDFANEDAPIVTASLADDLTAAGIPIPGEVVKAKKSGLKSVINAIKSFMNGDDETEEPDDSQNSQSSQNSQGSQNSPGSKNSQTPEANAPEDSQNSQTSQSPEAEEKKQPESPKNRKVIDSGAKAADVSDFVKMARSAHDLFNSLP